jgi:hypothetical protein
MPNRSYPHDIQNLDPEFLRRSSSPPEKTMADEVKTEDVKTILQKLDGLASAELLRRMQGQQVTDKREILESIDGLRKETRTEIQSIRHSQDVTNTAVNAVTERVKKLEVLRSIPPRSGSPMPRTYDLSNVEKTATGGLPTSEAEKLVKRLNELELDQEVIGAELHSMVTERDEAKKLALVAQEKEHIAQDKERIAQERQGAIDLYARGLEKEAKRKRARLMKIGGALLPVALAIGGALAKLLHL